MLFVEAAKDILNFALGDMGNQVDEKRNVRVESVPIEKTDSVTRAKANPLYICGIIAVDGDDGAWADLCLSMCRSG